MCLSCCPFALLVTSRQGIIYLCISYPFLIHLNCSPKRTPFALYSPNPLSTVHEARELRYEGEATFVECFLLNTRARENERPQRSASTQARAGSENPSWKSSTFEFPDVTERDARDGEIIIKIKEETRNFKEAEITEARIPLEKAMNGERGVERIMSGLRLKKK